MSKRDLSHVYNKLSLAIQGNFDKQVEIIGKVTNIGENQFTIQSTDLNQSINCSTKKSVENINVDDQIFVSGWIKLGTNTFMINMIVDNYYLYSDDEKYKEMSKIYKKIRKSLETEKYQIICKKHQKISLPHYLYNIGLVCLPGTDPAEFKEEFIKKCYGKLFIYRATNNISVPFEYFRKYHDINMIVLLADNIDLDQVYQISTIENIKFLLHRKNFPFVMSINDPDENFPLTNLLSNMRSNNIHKAISTICNSQTIFDRNLDAAIKLGKKILRQNIRDRKDKLLKLELDLTDTADPGWISSVEETRPTNLIKNLLFGQLTQYYCEMSNKYQDILKSILEDPRIEQTFGPIIESEKDFEPNADFGQIDPVPI